VRYAWETPRSWTAEALHRAGLQASTIGVICEADKLRGSAWHARNEEGRPRAAFLSRELDQTL
jgi:hypothetical protein